MSKRDKASKNDECVKVAVRCRPLNDDELSAGKKSIVEVFSQRGEISIKPSQNNPPKTYAFDNVYDWNAKQETIYQETAFPIVDSVLEGYNGTIFAYGQTGTGKTHTMEGKSDSKELKGIIPRAFEQIFKQIEGTPNKQFLVRVSFLEIYNEEIRDLLAPNTKNKLDLHLHKEGGFYVKDLISFPVQSVEEMHKKLAIGSKSRATAETEMNKGSSRSHSIFTITVEASEIGPDGQNHIRMGKLNLVDLAGSERQSKTKTTGSEFTEAININQSLTTLGNVISALVSTKSMHIPYRESKLTMLLQDSLGGNTKTVMIANIGPADWNSEETETTLRYAHRAKNIKNKPRINEDPKDAMLREFQDEIMRLRAQLEQVSGGKIMSNTVGVIGGEKILRVEDEEKMREMEAKLAKEKEEFMIEAEKERKRIEAQKNLAEEKKNELLQNLQEQIESQKKAQEEQTKLLKKLGAMEKKVIKGKKALEHALKQEKENQQMREELEKKKQKEKELEEELQKKEVENILKEEKFKNQEDEIKDKKNKLQKLFKKFQELKDELHEQQEEFNREREGYQEQLYDLSQQLKLKNLIINYFIPVYEVQKIELRSVWSDELDDWVLPNLHLAGNSLHPEKPGSSYGFSRPVSEHSRIARSLGDANLRYRGENIIDHHVELPEKVLEDYQSEVSEKVKKIIRSCTSFEEDEMTLMNMENRPNVYYMYTDDGIELDDGSHEKAKKRILKSAKKKPSSAKKREEVIGKPGSKEVLPEEDFPKAKGLVTKTGFR